MSVESLSLKPSRSRKNVTSSPMRAELSTTWDSLTGLERSLITFVVARHVAGHVEHVAFEALEGEPEAAAGLARQVGRLAQDAGPERLGLGVERHHGVAVGGREMHAEQAGRRPLAQRHHVMLGAVAAQPDRVAALADRLEAPDMAVERGGLMQIAHPQLDAAQSGYFGIGHGETFLEEANSE